MTPYDIATVSPPPMKTPQAAYSAEQSMGEFALSLALLRYVTHRLQDVARCLENGDEMPRPAATAPLARACWQAPATAYDVPNRLHLN